MVRPMRSSRATWGALSSWPADGVTRVYDVNDLVGRGAVAGATAGAHDPEAHAAAPVSGLGGGGGGGLALPTGEFDTVGGFMIEQLGRALVIGDRVETDDAVLVVQSVRARRHFQIRRQAYKAPNTGRVRGHWLRTAKALVLH